MNHDPDSVGIQLLGPDPKVGTAMERFVEAEFASHGVEVFSGDYDEDGHGECDIAVPTPEVLVFLELKKKTLTRQARAGIDAELLLSLAGSMLDAHAQAGWHELRITRAGFLESVWKFTGGWFGVADWRPWRRGSWPRRHRGGPRSRARGDASGSSSRRCVQPPIGGAEPQSPSGRRIA